MINASNALVMMTLGLVFVTLLVSLELSKSVLDSWLDWFWGGSVEVELMGILETIIFEDDETLAVCERPDPGLELISGVLTMEDEPNSAC